MRRVTFLLSAAAFAIGLAAPLAVADHHEATKAGSMTQAMMAQIKDAESKLVELAEATPAKTYTWRPAEGVRSVAETFLHVAVANYAFPFFLGTKPPEGVDFQTLEKKTTDKDEVIEILEQSFEHVLATVEKVPESDFGKMVKLPFGDFTTLDAVMIVVTHGHEHLGQSIAYARSNGIVPPWTTRQQAAQEDAKKTEKGDE